MSIKKIAFFVEGYTEVLLIKELAMFYYGENSLTYVLYRLRGGNKIPIKIKISVLEEIVKFLLAINIYPAPWAQNF